MPAKRILSMVARHVGGVTIFWENLRQQFADIEVVYFLQDTRTFFDDVTRTLHFNVYDPLTHVYQTLARHVNPDDYEVLVANERFELEYYLWSRSTRPLAAIIHTNHEHSYSFALRHAGSIDHLFCVSETAESYLRTRGIQHISTFRYSTFITIPPSPPEQRQKRVLYVGRLEPDKNIIETLELFKRFKRHGYEVRMIGVGSMESHVRSSLEPSEVRIGIPRHEVLAELANARFLCLNSYIEGLPIIYSEAMHFGLGVICNYLDKSSHQVLGENALLNSTPEALLFRMETFIFKKPPLPHRINNPALNEVFIASLKTVPKPTAPRPVFRPGTSLDNLGWVPAVLIRTYRARKMKRLHK
jgi:glycosyltransferase involved in cell wall biosynthesis